MGVEGSGLSGALFGIAGVLVGALAVTAVMQPVIAWSGGPGRLPRTVTDVMIGYLVGAVAAAALLWLLDSWGGEGSEFGSKAVLGAVVALVLNCPDLVAAVRHRVARCRTRGGPA